MPSDQWSGQPVGHERQFADGLPPKAQFAYALSALVVGVFAGLVLDARMDTGLALPLGVVLGTSVVTLATISLWYFYCRYWGNA